MPLSEFTLPSSQISLNSPPPRMAGLGLEGNWTYYGRNISFALLSHSLCGKSITDRVTAVTCQAPCSGLQAVQYIKHNSVPVKLV